LDPATTFLGVVVTVVESNFTVILLVGVNPAPDIDTIPPAFPLVGASVMLADAVGVCTGFGLGTVVAVTLKAFVAVFP
jgi:hypothetical protein